MSHRSVVVQPSQWTTSWVRCIHLLWMWPCSLLPCTQLKNNAHPNERPMLMLYRRRKAAGRQPPNPAKSVSHPWWRSGMRCTPVNRSKKQRVDPLFEYIFAIFLPKKRHWKQERWRHKIFITEKGWHLPGDDFCLNPNHPFRFFQSREVELAESGDSHKTFLLLL